MISYRNGIQGWLQLLVHDVILARDSYKQIHAFFKETTSTLSLHLNRYHPGMIIAIVFDRVENFIEN
jgi:hypothetical protein